MPSSLSATLGSDSMVSKESSHQAGLSVIPIASRTHVTLETVPVVCHSPEPWAKGRENGDDDVVG